MKANKLSQNDLKVEVSEDKGLQVSDSKKKYEGEEDQVAPETHSPKEGSAGKSTKRV